MIGTSMMGVKSWCRLRRISRILFGTTTTKLLGSGIGGMKDASAEACGVGEAVAASRNAEGWS